MVSPPLMACVQPKNKVAVSGRKDAREWKRRSTVGAHGLVIFEDLTLEDEPLGRRRHIGDALDLALELGNRRLHTRRSGANNNNKRIQKLRE